jgi:hypothetical protein
MQHCQITNAVTTHACSAKMTSLILHNAAMLSQPPVTQSLAAAATVMCHAGCMRQQQLHGHPDISQLARWALSAHAGLADLPDTVALAVMPIPVRLSHIDIHVQRAGVRRIGQESQEVEEDKVK